MARTLEQQIRKVIRQHYGEDLWMFRDDVNYREGTRDFVADVAKAIRGELEYLNDLPSPIAKYSKFSSIDRTLGGIVRELRIKRGITQEQLASNIGFSAEFLNALEEGYVVPAAGVWGRAYYALTPTKQENKECMSSVFSNKTPEEMIREVVELYYGWSLWAFKPDVGYEDAIAPFIKDLAALSGQRHPVIRGWIRVKSWCLSEYN